MALRDKEKYVAEIIKDEFLKNHSNVFYTEGEDPPDIYLEYDSKKVAIELTELSSNLQNDSMSISKSYNGFIKNIKIPDYTHYLVVFYHANIKLNKTRRAEIKYFLENPNTEMKKCINGVLVKIKSKPKTKKAGTIYSMCYNINFCDGDVYTTNLCQDVDIKDNFNFIINKAIETKKCKCKAIEKPVWLAMHDTYFSYIFNQNKTQSIELYKNTMKNIDFGIFEKMIIIFKDNGIIVFDKTTINKL